MLIKRINKEIFDELISAKLSKNKNLYQELLENYEPNLYEEINVDESKVLDTLDHIDYINTLLEKDLQEYEEGIYAGVAYSNLYEFDFHDRSVAISLNLLDHFVFFPDYSRVWFYSDLTKNTYILANYETSEIVNYIGDETLKGKLMARFDYKLAIKEILQFVEKASMSELFYYMK